MANYYAQARSNYFEVKDATKFVDEMAKYPIEVITNEVDGRTLYGIMDANQDGSGLDWNMYDEETGEETELDWIEILSNHLADDHIAVLMEVGTEKYRYLNGIAFAVNNKKEVIRISLDDIYDKAKETLGSQITTATY
jgi:hypothetical protein